MNKKGFTLIEIIGVVTVLSLILIVAVPALTKTLKRNEQNRYDEFVSTYETAAENYLMDKFQEGKIFEEYMVFSIGELIDARYIKEILVDPKTDEKITRNYKIKVTQNLDETYKYELFNSDVLPSEYQEVEYIESTGTQYIDTKYVPTTNTSLKIKLTYGEETAFGSAGETIDTLVVAAHNGNEYVRYFKYVGDIIYTNPPEWYELEVTPTYANFIGSDGSNNSINYVHEGSTSGYSAYIFARNVTGTAIYFSSRKIYYLKIYDRDDLVRDFVPCYRKSDGVIGFFDKANYIFYTNKGTGSFLKGNNVE